MLELQKTYKFLFCLCFLDFPRIRLAAHELLPGGTCVFTSFWVSSMNRLATEDEPPGGTNTVTLSLADLNNFGVPVMWP